MKLHENCINCGSNDIKCMQDSFYFYQIRCTVCFMRGPRAQSEEKCWEFWDLLLSKSKQILDDREMSISKYICDPEQFFR